MSQVVLVLLTEFGGKRLLLALQIVDAANKLSKTIEDADGRVERLRQPTELPICELLSREELGAARSRAMRERIMDSFYTPTELQIMEVKRFVEGRDIETLIVSVEKKLVSCSICVRKDLEKVAGDDEAQILETGMENLVTVATNVANKAAATSQIVKDAISVSLN